MAASFEPMVIGQQPMATTSSMPIDITIDPPKISSSADSDQVSFFMNGSVPSTSSMTSSMDSKTASDTMIQLKIYNKPVDFWKRRYKDQEFRYKISSIDMDRRQSEVICEIYDGQESSNINDCIQDNNLIKISIMKDGSCVPMIQEQFGHKFDAEEFVLFTTAPVDQDKMVITVTIIQLG